jgi:DNA-directed RNA polymerase specialized sigma24 family protein
MGSHDTSLGGADRGFPETVWDVLSRVQEPSGEARERAFDVFCRRYWKPAYSFLRVCRKKSNEDAKDLAQSFFAWLIEGDALAQFSPERGRFRPYLRTLLKHFDQHHDAALARVKRGGATSFVPLTEEIAPRAGAEDPDQAFEAAWRTSILERAVDAVRDRLRAAGQEAKYLVFEGHDCVSPEERPSYAGLGAKLGLGADDVRSYLRQVRQAVRAQVREELSRTVSSPEELEEEWNGFLQA